MNGVVNKYSEHEKYSHRPEIKERRQTQQKSRNKQLRSRFFEMDGNKCACPNCPETNHVFFSLDHVQNDGNKRREKYGNNNLKEYREAVKEYRPDLFQILCYNCNHAKHLNGGKCPHTYI